METTAVKGRRHFSCHNFLITYFISYGQLCEGYGACIISTTLASPSFNEYMGLVGPSGISTDRQNSLIGSTNGVFQAGAFVNIFITCYLLETFGRKKTIYYNILVGLLGGSILTGSQNIGMFLAGRWFTGMSVFGFLTATPIFTSELAPPDLRGFYSGLNGVHIGMGYLLAVCMGRAFAEVSGEANWRAPLGIYLFFLLMMIVITFMAPESPRWLLMKGQREKAREIVYRLHTVQGDKEWAHAEFEEMEKQIDIDRTLESSWASGRSIRTTLTRTDSLQQISMFRKPSYRKRTLICSLYMFVGQSTGVLVLNNYGPLFYKALGYDTIQRIDFQVGWASLIPSFGFIGAVLLDRVGRRILLLVGIGGCCLCLCVEAAAVATFESNPKNLAVGRLGVAALYLFNICYNLGTDVGGIVFYAEVFPNHIRHKGVSIVNAVLALTDLVYLEVTALAFANIGYRYFLVFISISAVGFFILWFVLPETKGIPLEEMGRLFGDGAETSMYLQETSESSEQGHLDRTKAASNYVRNDVANDAEKGKNA